MKLTSEQINQMAAELLGIEWQEYDNYGIRNPDFIHDANASRRLVMRLVSGDYSTGSKFDKFIRSLTHNEPPPLIVLAYTPKNITLAVLYAVGKITLEQAREAMEGDE